MLSSPQVSFLISTTTFFFGNRSFELMTPKTPIMANLDIFRAILVLLNLA
jgi:hypothetical protein